MWALAARDLRIVTGSSAVMIPLIVVPLVFVVLLPVGLAVAVHLGGSAVIEGANLAASLERMPLPMASRLAGLEPIAQLMVLVLGYLMAPMFLILPLMVASVIAADSFAGEKERKTLEALLYTPTSDVELFGAKLLVALVPAIAVSWGGLLIYSAVADAVAYPYLHRLLLPDPLWLVLVLWVAPAVAGLGLGVTVLVSARVRSFQEAYQLGGVVVLPIIALVAGQAAGVVYLDTVAALVVGALLWVLDVALMAVGLRSFSRDALASRA
ncbi:MAG: ABC transporter permease subunit [Deinococcales bacterium]